MSTPGQPTPDQPHRNHGLFSDHYLNVSLPERPDWRALEDEANGAMQDVARILDSYTPSANEAQVEEEVVRPVLRALGHEGIFEVQPALATPEGTKRPDYVFYRDAASLAANKNKTLDDERLRGSAFAVGDAKYWDRPLDVALKGKRKDSLTDNPSFQISFYMRHAGTE